MKRVTRVCEYRKARKACYDDRFHSGTNYEVLYVRVKHLERARRGKHAGTVLDAFSDISSFFFFLSSGFIVLRCGYLCYTSRSTRVGWVRGVGIEEGDISFYDMTLPTDWKTIARILRMDRAYSLYYESYFNHLRKCYGIVHTHCTLKCVSRAIFSKNVLGHIGQLCRLG